MRGNFFLVDALIRSHQVEVKVLTTDAQWYGVTYKEDKMLVQNKLLEFTTNNDYPTPLWNK